MVVNVMFQRLNGGEVYSVSVMQRNKSVRLILYVKEKEG
jgi:hypothetical protein